MLKQTYIYIKKINKYKQHTMLSLMCGDVDSTLGIGVCLYGVFYQEKAEMVGLFICICV